MMQQVAATSTELAAAASTSASKSNSKDTSNGEFSMLFDQQQQSSSSPSTANSASSNNTAPLQDKTAVTEQPVSDEKTSIDNEPQKLPEQNVTADKATESSTATKETPVADISKEETTSAVGTTDDVVDGSEDMLSIEAELAKLQQEAATENMTWVGLLEKIKQQFTEQDGVVNDNGNPEVTQEDIVQAITDFIQQQLAQQQSEGESLPDDIQPIALLQQYIAHLQSQEGASENELPAESITKLSDDDLLALLVSLPENDVSPKMNELRSALLLETEARGLNKDVLATTASEKGQQTDAKTLITNVATPMIGEEKTPSAAVTKEDMQNQGLQGDQNAQVATSTKHSDVVVKSTDLDPLLQASAEKINNLLVKLAEKVLPEATSEVKHNFVASLKVGLEEMRTQLQQGHEPGIDLQSLVSKTVGDISAKNSGDQSLSQQRQTPLFDIAQLLSPSSQANHAALASAELNTYHDGLINSVEANKLAQGTSLDKLDKAAVVLQKAEGLKQVIDKVQLMVNQKTLVADIRLDPPELGSMQIRLHMSNEQASVSFVVQSQQARDALDQSAPKLKEMLAERGIELGQSSVRQDKGKNGDAEQQGQQQGQLAQQPEEQAEGVISQQLNVVNGAVSGIDFFV
ncbi:flagellar hook-length control protein FliK [Alteromonadaceae bacterium BrNp21-10]|nr:flagellar hook-length control protein FliK [Alteromonadaceae bacterium BrNp21-10]